jgi:hypothetical protein
VLSLGAGIVRDLAITSGPAADGIINNSYRRLLARLRVRDANAAELEMEELLKCLHTMWHLTGSARARTAKDPGDRRQPAATPGPLSTDLASLPGHDDQVLIPTEEL